MAQGVLDQVDREAVQLVARALHGRGLDIQLDVVHLADRTQLARGLDDDLVQGARLVRDDAADVGAREQQQIRYQTAHAPGGAQGRARGVALFAVQRVGQQLEVGEHARQGRTQLVRGVGDEPPLAGEHRLRLPTRGVQLPEHALQRARQLSDLVVGLWLRDAAGGVAGARDLLGGRGQLGDRRHRAPGDRDPGEQRERGAREHPQQQEQLDAGDRRLRCPRPSARTG